MKNWKIIALVALGALLTVGLGTPWAQQATRVLILYGSSLVSASNPLPVNVVAGGAGGGAVTVADGADVTQGAIADAAATQGSTGTISAKLRTVTSQLNSLVTAISFGSAQVTSASVTFNSSGDNIVVTRATGTIKVYGLVLGCASALTTLTMKNGAGTTLGPISNVSSIFLPISRTPYYTTTSTNNFIINLSSGVQCGGTVYYIDS